MGMSHDDGDWVFVHRYETRLEGRGGWVPTACVARHAAKKYEVPYQKSLQGEWVTEAGKLLRVRGAIVSLRESRIPYVIRSSEDGKSTTLLGCSLVECDDTTARWSNGDVWKRIEKEPDIQDTNTVCADGEVKCEG